MTKTSLSEECSECSKNIYGSDDWVDWPAADERFCSRKCAENFTERTGKTQFDFKSEEQKQKHEKIEKMAWELFLDSPQEDGWTFCDCWKVAEDFYKFAKAKQEEANDE